MLGNVHYCAVNANAPLAKAHRGENFQPGEFSLQGNNPRMIYIVLSCAPKMKEKCIEVR